MPGTRRRPPAVAGAFYPDEPGELRAMIGRCFLDRRGPGRSPGGARADARRTIRAVIVPHAGYTYSGAIAAHAFLALSREPPPAAVLALGVNHHGLGAPAALSDLEWETPLGTVVPDRTLVSALSRGPVIVDNGAHAREHSIEVELPFLQTIWPKVPVVALSVQFGTLGFLTEVGAVVARGVRERDVVLLASTDFSHYVPADTARSLDRRALDAIRSGRADRLYETVNQHDISMCGVAPTTSLLASLEGKPVTFDELAYGHSGEVQAMRDVVGYASLVAREPVSE